jgi:hypothetical protein
MRSTLIPLLVTALLLPLCASAQSSGNPATKPNHDSAKFVDVWRGEFDNLPGIDMVITDEGGDLHGAILFYLHKRMNVNSPYTATPGLPEPLFDLRRDGQTLHFDVSHRRAHPPGSLNDAPKTLQLKLTGPDRAELINESEGAPMVEMKRSDY